MKSRESLERKKAPKFAAAALAAIALLGACINNQESTPETAPISASPSAVPKDPSLVPSPDVNPSFTSTLSAEASTTASTTEENIYNIDGEEVHYPGVELPPVPTNYQEAKGFAEWYQQGASKSTIFTAIETGNADYFLQNRAGIPELEASVNVTNQMIDFIKSSGLLDNPASENAANVFLRTSTLYSIIYQAALDNPSITSKLTTEPQMLVVSDLEQRNNSDPAKFGNAALLFATIDYELIPEPLMVNGKLNIDDSLIQNHFETTSIPAEISDPKNNTIIGLGTLLQELSQSCAVKLAGGTTSCDINTFLSGRVGELLNQK